MKVTGHSASAGQPIVPVASAAGARLDELYLHAAARIATADGILIAAGAGMGVDAGLPDFRGRAGLWRAYPALGRRRLGFADIATPSMFLEDPCLAWGFYGHRLDMYRRAVPHDGFGALLRWSKLCQHGARVFTSNVDGMFQRAGFDPRQVVECHGSIHTLQCVQPCSEATWSAQGMPVQIDASKCLWCGDLPCCPACGAVARPNVLMFGDWGWVGPGIDRANTSLDEWLGGLRRPVVVEIGAGTAIPSVRRRSESVAKRHDAFLIRINPRDSTLGDRVEGLSIPHGGLIALSGIDRALKVTHPDLS